MTALAYGHLLLDIMLVSYSLQQGVYTDSDMQDEALRCKMDSRIDQLLNFATTRGLSMTGSGDIELVVQLKNLNVKCEYYFVDHLNRSLFWVHEQDGEDLCDGVRGVEKMNHISAPSDLRTITVLIIMFTEYAVEQWYWQVCHFVGWFPYMQNSPDSSDQQIHHRHDG